MIPPLIERHAEELKKRLSNPLRWRDLSIGASPPIQAVAVEIENIVLPPGWSKTTTMVRFLVAHAYPVAPPDCFWADADLTLSGNRTPQNTGRNPMPGTTEPLLWFSWHVQQWDPNRHRLDSFYQAIRDRLERAQ